MAFVRQHDRMCHLPIGRATRSLRSGQGLIPLCLRKRDEMGWISGIAVYFIIWWVVIFAVLPWGVQSAGDNDLAKGQERGAPKNPRILIKMAVTTVVAAVIWVIVYLIIE